MDFVCYKAICFFTHLKMIWVILPWPSEVGFRGRFGHYPLGLFEGSLGLDTVKLSNPWLLVEHTVRASAIADNTILHPYCGYSTDYFKYTLT